MLHCFPLNGNSADPTVLDVYGILKTYREAVNAIEFAGPTLFGPILKEVLTVCEA